MTIDEIDRVTTLLNDFMSLAKPERTTQNYVDVSEMAQTVGQLIATEAALKGIRFKVLLEERMFIWGDASQIKQVVLNVLQNALQACCDNTDEVTLCVEPKIDQVALSVRDSGSGMTQIQLQRMFDPFYTTKPTGTGMGMAVTKRIIDEHGGTIEVQSAVGQGTTVYIRLKRVVLPSGGDAPDESFPPESSVS